MRFLLRNGTRRAAAALSLFVCGLLSGAASSAAPLDELVARAKKERAPAVMAPSGLGPQGAQELGAAFNKKYGLSLKLNYISSNSFTADVAKVISQSALGVPAEWDVMVMNDSQHAELWLRKLLVGYDYKSLGI